PITSPRPGLSLRVSASPLPSAVSHPPRWPRRRSTGSRSARSCGRNDNPPVSLGTSITIVEDDQELRAVLVRGLHEEGFAVDDVATGAELLDRIKRATPDALVIDIGLPDTDGRDLCHALRVRGIQTPVLFLTARDAVVDRIAGFDAGGDDYLSKPFEFVELVARLQALLRRGGADGGLESGRLTLDPLAHSLSDDSREVPLTPTE